MVARDIASGFGLDLIALEFAVVFIIAFVQWFSLLTFRLTNIHHSFSLSCGYFGEFISFLTVH